MLWVALSAYIGVYCLTWGSLVSILAVFSAKYLILKGDELGLDATFININPKNWRTEELIDISLNENSDEGNVVNSMEAKDFTANQLNQAYLRSNFTTYQISRAVVYLGVIANCLGLVLTFDGRWAVR